SRAKRAIVQSASWREPRPMRTRQRVLFIGGALNQTTQLHAVARELPECEARFTPFYGDAVVETMRRFGLIEMSIAGNKRRGWCLEYLRDHGLAVDLGAREGDYDLIVHCTDLLIPRNVRGVPL